MITSWFISKNYHSSTTINESKHHSCAQLPARRCTARPAPPCWWAPWRRCWPHPPKPSHDPPRPYVVVLGVPTWRRRAARAQWSQDFEELLPAGRKTCTRWRAASPATRSAAPPRRAHCIISRRPHDAIQLRGASPDYSPARRHGDRTGRPPAAGARASPHGAGQKGGSAAHVAKRAI